jgi:hypothetical protein
MWWRCNAVVSVHLLGSQTLMVKQLTNFSKTWCKWLDTDPTLYCLCKFEYSENMFKNICS